jgi:predicted RNase H-like HicB family nuclease
MENKRIEIDIVIYPEGKGDNKVYSISSMQFPNVVTQGDSIEQAKSRLKEALELYFESAPWEKKKLLIFEEQQEESDNSPMISKIFL